MISKSVEETGKIARNFAQKVGDIVLSSATIIALEGDLGSGKTTFTKAFAAAFGIAPETITSPTFIIQKTFDVKNHSYLKNLIHIDAYRLEKAEEIEKLSWNEVVKNPANIIVVEWPSNIGAVLPKNAVRVSFKFIDENTREIVFN